MKWHNLYGKLLSYRRLHEAWEKVKFNGGLILSDLCGRDVWHKAK
mgnify:CR=1 FL=1